MIFTFLIFIIIDTHAHINFAAFKEDGDESIKRSLAQDTWLINVGSQDETSERAVWYAQKYKEGVFAAVGLHPFHLVKQEIKSRVDKSETIKFETRPEEFDYDFYKTLAQKDKVVAIGEAGLDYYYMENSQRPLDEKKIKELENLQKEVFIKQLELAAEINQPVIVHCRQAHEDVLKILELRIKNQELKIKGVIHSFSGRWSQAERYLAIGLYLGFNGIITFARDYDRVVKEIPLERLLLETDCPYLTPAPFRGKRNEPAYVCYVAEKIAELRGITFEKVVQQTTKNARELFRI